MIKFSLSHQTYFSSSFSSLFASSKQPALNKFISIFFTQFFLFSLFLSAAPVQAGGAVQAIQKNILFAYQAEYSLHWQGLTLGNSFHALKKMNNNHYQATASSLPKIRFLPFSDFESSQFRFQDQNIVPLQYQFKKEENHKKQRGFLEFDWKINQVKKQSFKISKTKKETTENITDFLLPKAQDKITHIFQLRKDLLLNRDSNKKFDYWVIEAERNRVYSFKIIGQERLKTRIGQFDTVILEHMSEDQTRRTRLWLSKELGYLMVKLIQIKNNKITAEAMIHSLNIEHKS